MGDNCERSKYSNLSSTFEAALLGVSLCWLFSTLERLLEAFSAVRKKQKFD